MKKYLYIMKKGGGSEFTIINRCFLVCSGLRSPQLRNFVGLARFRVFLIFFIIIIIVVPNDNTSSKESFLHSFYFFPKNWLLYKGFLKIVILFFNIVTF